MSLDTSVPTPPENLKLLCVILNFIPFLAGIGTIIAGVTDKTNVARDVVVGILQLVLTFALIGWIWSIVWAVVMLKR